MSAEVKFTVPGTLGLVLEARGKYKGIRLRFRREYIPVREEPEWVH
jgi:hypothetical protein